VSDLGNWQNCFLFVQFLAFLLNNSKKRNVLSVNCNSHHTIHDLRCYLHCRFCYIVYHRDWMSASRILSNLAATNEYSIMFNASAARMSQLACWRKRRPFRNEKTELEKFLFLTHSSLYFVSSFMTQWMFQRILLPGNASVISRFCVYYLDLLDKSSGRIRFNYNTLNLTVITLR
jgi:hypothetical protein